MWKRKSGRKLSREKGQRTALLISLVRELFTKEKIKTTEAKAKELSRYAEKIITKTKKNTLAGRRTLTFLNSKEAKTFSERNLSAFKNRNGGYTRVVKIGPRTGNSAQMAFIELVK